MHALGIELPADVLDTLNKFKFRRLL